MRNLKFVPALYISQTLPFGSKPDQTYTYFQTETKFEDTKSDA